MKKIKPYLAGLISSDGSVLNSKFYLELTDEQLIRDIANYLSIPYCTRERYRYDVKVKDAHRVCFNISDFGVKDKNFETYFYSLSSEDKDLYMQGLFEGDGCFHLTRMGNPQVSLLCGGSELHQYRIIEYYLKFNSLKYTVSFQDNCYSFRLTGSYNSLCFLSLIYSNRKIVLLRKYNKYIKCRWNYLSQAKTNHFKFICFYNGEEFITYDRKEIADKYGIDSRRISDLIYGIREEYKGLRIKTLKGGV